MRRYENAVAVPDTSQAPGLQGWWDVKWRLPERLGHMAGTLIGMVGEAVYCQPVRQGQLPVRLLPDDPFGGLDRDAWDRTLLKVANSEVRGRCIAALQSLAFLRAANKIGMFATPSLVRKEARVQWSGRMVSEWSSEATAAYSQAVGVAVTAANVQYGCFYDDPDTYAHAVRIVSYCASGAYNGRHTTQLRLQDNPARLSVAHIVQSGRGGPEPSQLQDFNGLDVHREALRGIYSSSSASPSVT